jgi:hypothetical protein
MLKCRTANIHFTFNLRRHVGCLTVEDDGDNERSLLTYVFVANPRVQTHVMGDAEEILAMGSTTGKFWVSENQGYSWEQVSNTLPQIYAVRFAG